MSTGRWMDKEVVVHIHNGLLLSHWKEYIWISSDEMDETGANYTEWSKPERKTPIQYTNTYILNLERWQWWPCMQDSKRDTDVYSRFLGSEGEHEGRRAEGQLSESQELHKGNGFERWGLGSDGSERPTCLGLLSSAGCAQSSMMWERERVGWFGRMALKHV